MITFDINSNSGDLGTRSVTRSNIEKHRADFCGFLDDGVVLASVTVAVTGGASLAGNALLSANHKAVTWTFSAASVQEQASFELSVTTNDGQTLKYTLTYAVGG